MTKFTKSLYAAVFGAAAMLGAVSAHATQFNVVVEKIELMKDGGSADRFVVYQPSAGIGEAATRSIDLFNATQKLGTALTIKNPPAGLYKTMLVTFGDITIGDDAGNVSKTLNTNLESLGVLGKELGRSVLILGDDGDGVGGTADIADLIGKGSAAPVQPITVGTGAFTLPSLNFFLPSDGTGVDESTGDLIATPTFIPAMSQNIDRADIPDVVVGVNETGFINTAAANAGNFTYRVGLFRSALDKRPVVSRAVAFISKTDNADIGSKEVTFLDVPEGTFFPVAWIDANSNQLWDQGELTAVAGGTVADLTFTVDYGATDGVVGDLVVNNVAKTISLTYVSGVSTTVDNDVSASVFPGGAAIATNLDDGFVGDLTPFTMPARGVSIAVSITNDVSSTGTDWESDGIAALSGLVGTLAVDGAAASASATGAAADGSLSIVVQLSGAQNATAASVSRTVVLTSAFGADTQGDAASLEDTETAYVGLKGATLPSDFSYDGSVLTFKAPYLGITTLGDNTAIVGTYRVAFGANVKTAVDTFTPTKLCQAVVAGCDDGIVPTSQLVSMTSGANVVSITAITD